MTRRGTVLPWDTIPEAREAVQDQQAAWIEGAYESFPLPRSKWLSDLEVALERLFPLASSRDRNVTARSLAPFPLEVHP